jgi:plastocyanin
MARSIPLKRLIVPALLPLFFSVGDGLSQEVPRAVTVAITDGASDRCDQAYDPPVIEVAVGTTVVWENRDNVTHTIVSGRTEDPCNPTELPIFERELDSGGIFQKGRFEHTFMRPGVYPYLCHLPSHRMSGKIIIK